MSNFQDLCDISNISSDKPKLFKLKGLEILVVQDLNGAVYAFENKCSHADKPLLRGKWNAKECEILCPFHKARFSLKDGRALCAPAVTPIEVYPTKINDSRIEVDIS